MPRKPSDEEEAMWKQVTTTVTPLGASEKNVVEVKKRTPVPKEKRSVRHVFVAEERVKLPPEKSIDRKQQRRLRRGDYEVEATLDLHGMTQDRAFDTLVCFLERARLRQHRIVLVVTGKGTQEVPGILRQALPKWISQTELSSLVIRMAPALPQHGGNGAYYLFLRRKKS